jgi:hypothetical protein
MVLQQRQGTGEEPQHEKVKYRGRTPIFGSNSGARSPEKQRALFEKIKKDFLVRSKTRTKSYGVN